MPLPGLPPKKNPRPPDGAALLVNAVGNAVGKPEGRAVGTLDGRPDGRPDGPPEGKPLGLWASDGKLKLEGEES